MTRGFVAVVPPAAVRDALAERVATVRDVAGVRWSPPDQWHFTLQFLPDADLDAVAASLVGVAAATGPVRLGGAGAFPRPGRAQVLWVGASEGRGALAGLAGAVAARTAALGHEADGRPYRPHLTVARCRSPRDVRRLVAGFADEPIGPAFTVVEIVVFESRTDPDRARYTARARLRLSELDAPERREERAEERDGRGPT